MRAHYARPWTRATGWNVGGVIVKCGMLADGHEPVGTNKNLWNNHGWPVRCALLAWLLWPPRLCKCKCNVYLVVVPRPRGGHGTRRPREWRECDCARVKRECERSALSFDIRVPLIYQFRSSARFPRLCAPRARPLASVPFRQPDPGPRTWDDPRPPAPEASRDARAYRPARRVPLSESQIM